jgi:hypothetical protein
MTDEIRKTEKKEVEVQGLSAEELEAQSGEQLPDREEMSLIDANVAAPVNAAVAANILSDGSIAYANAEQTVDIDQTNQ